MSETRTEGRERAGKEEMVRERRQLSGVPVGEKARCLALPWDRSELLLPLPPLEPPPPPPSSLLFPLLPAPLPALPPPPSTESLEAQAGLELSLV